MVCTGAGGEERGRQEGMREGAREGGEARKWACDLVPEFRARRRRGPRSTVEFLTSLADILPYLGFCGEPRGREGLGFRV